MTLEDNLYDVLTDYPHDIETDSSFTLSVDEEGEIKIESFKQNNIG